MSTRWIKARPTLRPLRKDLRRGQIMSRFNTQVISLDCAAKEGKKTHCATAKAAEQDAVLLGDYNFKGIGR